MSTVMVYSAAELLYETKHSTAYDVSTNLLTCVYIAESMGKITT